MRAGSHFCSSPLTRLVTDGPLEGNGPDPLHLTLASGFSSISEMTHYGIISADAHVLGPQLTKDSEGGDGWLDAGSSEPDPIGLTATPGMVWATNGAAS